MKIETGKHYRTRDGHKVRIYATDGANNYVHGAVNTEQGWHTCNWRSDGIDALGTGDFDIFSEWHEPKLRPWRAEEAPIGAVLKYKKQEARWMITGSGGNGIYMGGALQPLQPAFVLEQCEHSRDGGTTWLPCGVEE